MSYEDKTNREFFETLKSYLDNAEGYMSKIIDNVILILINRRMGKHDGVDEKRIESFSNYVKCILSDLYEDYVNRIGSQNHVVEDIEYIGSGFTSIAFRVGDNVIKIGKNGFGISSRNLDSIYQVPIYIRESREVGNNIHFIVEVAPFVDTTNITYEDSYRAYSNIRSLGYVWNDPKEENLGRIISIGGCKIGGIKYFPQQQYKKGDLVVIDLEDIAYVGEETSDIILEEIATGSHNKNVYIFENRYIKDKEGKKLLKNFH